MGASFPTTTEELPQSEFQSWELVAMPTYAAFGSLMYLKILVPREILNFIRVQRGDILQVAIRVKERNQVKVSFRPHSPRKGLPPRRSNTACPPKEEPSACDKKGADSPVVYKVMPHGGRGPLTRSVSPFQTNRGKGLSPQPKQAPSPQRYATPDRDSAKGAGGEN